MLQQWLGSRNELLLHKDCIDLMIEKRVSEVIIMDPADREVQRVFKESGQPFGNHKHIAVAVRIPKDDTKNKDEKKAEAKKAITFPKFESFSGRTNAAIGGEVSSCAKNDHIMHPQFSPWPTYQSL